MTFDELTDSAKAALYDRLKTPFFASFLFAWLCWNWDFLYFLFESETEASTTIRNASSYIDWRKSVWYPFLTSLTVFLAGGLLNLLYYWIRLGFRWVRVKKLDKSETITIHQRDKLIEEHIKNRKDLSQKVAELHEEVFDALKANEDLKRQNETLLLELSGLRGQVARPREDGGKKDNDDTLDDSPTPPDGPNAPITSPIPTGEEKYAFNDTVLAKDGTFETMPAKVLSEREGTVIVWFEVTREHNEGTEEAHQYILAHNGDNGRKMIVGGRDVYRNTWAILRRKGNSPQWRFTTSNKNGTSGSSKLVDRRVLSPGWHSIGIAWSRDSKIVDFVVDGSLKGSDVFDYWPDEIESTMTIGTWPAQTQRGFDFRGKVGPVLCYDRRLNETEIKRIDFEKQLNLRNLERYFPGTWELEYSNGGKIDYDKNIQIKNGNEYYVNGKLHFILEDIVGNLDQGLLMFKKRRVNGPPDVAENRLRIVELGRRYEGEEYGGNISVKYYRVD